MQNFDKNAVTGRIRSLREQYAGSRGKSDFARALGISASTYNYYENDRIPPPEILIRICQITGADLEWLLTGGSSSEKRFASGQNRELLDKLDALLGDNPNLTDAVSAFIELLCEKKGIEKQIQLKVPTSKSERPGWIPVLGRTAAGIVHFWEQELLPQPQQAVTELDELVKKHLGKEIIGSTDATLSVDLQMRALLDAAKEKRANLIQICSPDPDQITEFIESEEIHKIFPDSFALRVDGDSMSPRINDDDIVILSPSVPAAQGQLAVARVAKQIGITCKLIRTTESGVHLIPINEKYETKVVPKKDLLWALAVLCHISV